MIDPEKSVRPDPIIDQVREVRHRISERFGHDARRLVEHYIEIQEQYRDRLVKPPKRESAEDGR